MLEFIMMYFGMKLIFFGIGIALIIIGLIGITLLK
tara:strand:+ start:112 stop:216 length:105 start_codon:yes stop_codon:yes gene_type:complete